MATLHVLPLILRRIKSKFLLSADKMLKPAWCPFSSLYKVKLFGSLFKSPDGYFKKWFGQLHWGQTGIQKNRRPKSKCPFCQFWITWDNHSSKQGRDRGKHLEQFSQSLSGASLPFGFSLMPAGGSNRPDQWPGCPRHGRSRSLPTFWPYTLAFSYHLPFAAWNTL